LPSARWPPGLAFATIAGVRTPGDRTAEHFEEAEPQADASSSADDVAAQRAALDDLARELVARGIATPAIFVLESMRPISFISAEFLVFLDPFVRLLLPSEKYSLIVEALHDRRNLSWLVDRLEELDAERVGGAHKPGPEPPAGQTGEHDDRPRA
jgi:hypothetical protein